MYRLAETEEKILRFAIGSTVQGSFRVVFLVETASDRSEDEPEGETVAGDVDGGVTVAGIFPSNT